MPEAIMDTPRDEPAKELNFDAMIDLDDDSFRKITALVYERFGINLTEKKRALVRGRLHSSIKAAGLKSFGDYYDYVLEDTQGERLLHLVDRISTNHTYFFREADHFEFLRDEIMEPLLDTTENIRIWCAGCSSGEEPYTAAMVLAEAFPQALGRIRILATDISTTALAQAATAKFPAQKAAGVPDQYRKFLIDDRSGQVGVSERIKSLVLFKRLNLMNETFPFRNQFHVVFCRNVMIYFDLETRKRLLNGIHRHMATGAHLFIGHSETLGREMQLFRYVRPTVYSRI